MDAKNDKAAESPFVRALEGVLIGTKSAHQVAEVLVRAAVAETMSLACSDYPLDYATLVKKYEDVVVERCCRACIADGFAQCEAKTKSTGVQCCKRAVLGGFCTQHMSKWKERIRSNGYSQAVQAVQPKHPASTKVVMSVPEDAQALL